MHRFPASTHDWSARVRSQAAPRLFRKVQVRVDSAPRGRARVLASPQSVGVGTTLPGWPKIPVRWRHRLPGQPAATDAGPTPLHRVRILSSFETEHPRRPEGWHFCHFGQRRANVTNTPARTLHAEFRALPMTSRTRFLITAAFGCHLLLAPSLVTSQLLSSSQQSGLPENPPNSPSVVKEEEVTIRALQQEKDGRFSSCMEMWRSATSTAFFQQMTLITTLSLVTSQWMAM